MLAALDRQRQFDSLRARLTLPNAIEMGLDPAMAVLSLIGSTSFHGESFGPHYIILGLITFSLTFPGNLQLSDSPRRMARKSVMNWLIIAAILLLFGYASGYERFFPDKILYGWMLVTPVSMVIAQIFVRLWLPQFMSSNHQTTAVVVGGNDIGMMLARQFKNDHYLGVRVAGFFDDRQRDRLSAIGDLPLLGDLNGLGEYVKYHHIGHIYIALPMATQPRILKLLDDLKDTTASIFFVPDIFVTDLIQGRMENINGMPVVSVCETPFTGMSGATKRCTDVLLSLLILLLISPVLLALAIAVKLCSPGPIIFKQRRYGLDGKEIVVYKFRSMTVCEDGPVVKQATKNDQRITPLGAFMRKTSLDELPQFFNVLQGRMSIVGPRPHAIAHNETYRKIIKGYMVRHKVKPGITGWAQVNGYRGETDTIEKMERRVDYDLEYLRDWSVSLDLWIIIKTVVLVFRDAKAY